MEYIPVINLQALNNPSLFSRIISTLELAKFSHAHRLWKWGAFLLALVYAFNYVANKLRFIILYYHNKSISFLANTQHLLSTFDDQLYTSDDEDEDDDVSISSNDDDEEESEDDGQKRGLSSNQDFSKQKFRVQKRRKSFGDDFSLSDLVNGNGIVKLWDGFGLGVESSFPFLELNNDIGSFFGSPAVVTGEPDDVLGLSVWDFRCSRSEPAVQWNRKGKVVEVDLNRTGKFSVRDDVTRKMTVGDVRMVQTPLMEEEEMWWDADGVGS